LNFVLVVAARLLVWKWPGFITPQPLNMSRISALPSGKIARIGRLLKKIFEIFAPKIIPI
jgi:hypothetical protein